EGLLSRARAEAEELVSAAREHAERIRRDSERELAAVTARRDAITAQLGNVRTMLATVGGGSVLGGSLMAAAMDDSGEEASPGDDGATGEGAEAPVAEDGDVVAEDGATVAAADEADAAGSRDDDSAAGGENESEDVAAAQEATA